MDDPLQTAWDELEKSWSDPAAHKKLIGLAASLGRLADAGRRYRDVRDGKDETPERREMAKKSIDQILAAGMAMITAEKTAPAPKQHPKLFFVAAGVCLAMVLFALWAFFRGE